MTPDQTAPSILKVLRGLSAQAERSAPVELDVRRAVLERLRRARRPSGRALSGRVIGTGLAVALLLGASAWYWASRPAPVEPDVGNPLAELLTSSGLQVELAEPNPAN